MTEFDVVVVGAGPAGLLAAAILGKNHRVAVIERGVLGRTTKFWVSTVRRLQKHGLDDCVLHRTSALIAGTFLGGRVVARGDLAVVNEEVLLTTLAGRCSKQGVVIADQSTLLNLSWTKDRIHIQTTGEAYLARLIVDATGGLSPVASTFRLHALDGFFSVYGAHLQNIRLRSPDIVLGYIDHLGDPPPVLEVIPTGEDSAYCVIFVCTRKLVPPQSLDTTFKKHCRYNPFFTLTAHTVYAVGKAGAIPIGRMRRRQLPGVVSFGEAGLIQPPLLGTGFNEILEHCDALCSRISHALDTGSIWRAAARHRYPLLKRAQDRLQLALVRSLMDGNVEVFDRLVRLMSELPPEVFFNLCSNELTWVQLLSAGVRLPARLLSKTRRSTRLNS